MRSRPVFDPQDLNGDFDSDANLGSFFVDPLNSHPVVSPTGASTASAAPAPVAPILPDESVQAMAAVSGSGSGGTGSVVAETSSSGFTINLIFDAAAMAAPASFRAGIEQAASILSATITNKITVNVNIDYSGTGGGAAAGPDNGQYVNYSTVRTDLIANAAPGDTSFNALPTGSTIQGQSQVAVWNAQLKLFGLISPNSTTSDDGSATFATDINPNLLVGVALHELTHAMGRVPYGQPSGPQPDIFDFYRFTSPGAQLFTDNIPASSAYFSLNGGYTKLADFGVSSDPSDFLNTGVQGSNDPFNEYYSSYTLQSLTPVDLKLLDALGFNTNPAGLAVVASTAEAMQGGAAVSLLSSAPNINDPGSTTLSSAIIRTANASGVAVAGDKLFVNGIESGALGNGINASWNATTDTLTLSGTAATAVYDTLLSAITFQDGGTDLSSGSHPVRTVTWTINDGTSSYNATSQIVVDRAPVATNSGATDVVGTTLATSASNAVLTSASDLDGDSLTVVAISDTAHGAGTVGTSLAGTYGHLTLNANGSYAYVADNAAAISGAPTGSHLQDIFSYTVSDGHGGTSNASLTITLDRLPVVTAANVTVDSSQAVAASSLFAVADLDGNAIATYALENTGSGHFVLNGVVEPSNAEIDVSQAQLSQLTYQAVPGSTADTVEVRVNDGTAWSSWTTFTATPRLVVETAGVTSLVELGNDYYLNPVAGGTGPELKYNGPAVVPGQFAGWALIGAEATSSGYEVAWKDAADGLYTVWNVDSSGNFINNPIGSVSPTSPALESLETSFHQDLNGDGVIGLNVPTTVIEAVGSTSLVEVGNNYFLDPVAGGTGPELKYNGAAVVPGQFAGWALIGAEATSSGYEVAWKDAADNLYTVWNVDSSGNFVNNPIGSVSPTSPALQSLETSFHQDLNGDGVIGLNVPTIVIEALGSTSLVEVGNNYFLDPVAGGTGPELKYSGAAVVPGQFTSWALIGAEATSSGYEVAWKDAADNLYTVWNTDSNGNFVNNPIGSVSPTNPALESLEPSFHQDLNSDGVIGVPATTQVSGTTSNIAIANLGSVGDASTVLSASAPAAEKVTLSTGEPVPDNFVFKANFGDAIITNFNPASDTIQVDHTMFANVSALLAAAHDDMNGNFVISDAYHDTINLKNVGTAQMLAHQSDFHFV
ncbi:MAG TPA: NF038122 family metalloprotease [Bradyrhizobium sp.]|nr:NF038122 family metalloprotease [Bradyrhizobium sp.]